MNLTSQSGQRTLLPQREASVEKYFLTAKSYWLQRGLYVDEAT
jgi:hypothetical protein